MAPGEWSTVYVTHVEDGLQARQRPFLTFWAQTDRTLSTCLDSALNALSSQLAAMSPPTDLERLTGFAVAFVGSKWIRCQVVGDSVRAHGLVDVHCLDEGSVLAIPLSSIRIVSSGGSSVANAVCKQPPLARKYFLADVVSPEKLWPDDSLRFVKTALRNQTWSALSLGERENGALVRLYNKSNNQLADILLRNRLAVQMAQLTTRSSMARRQVAYYTMGNATRTGAVYTCLELEQCVIHQVVVTNIEDSVRKFTVQLKQRAAELEDLRSKLNCVRLGLLKDPVRGRPCLALHSKDQLLRRALVVRRHGDQCHVYYVDYGNAEMVNVQHLFEIPDELVRIEVLAYRLSLHQAEALEHVSGVEEAFTWLAAREYFECVALCGYPQEVLMRNKEGKDVKQLISSVPLKGASPPASPTLPAKAPIRRERKVSGPSVRSEEQLFITFVQSGGKFFGQLERLPMRDLVRIHEELFRAYGSLSDSPLLYNGGTQSHVGQFAIVKWSIDDLFYRVQIQEESLDEVQVLFVDYGNLVTVTRGQVLAPVSALRLFTKPAFGINCQFTWTPPVGSEEMFIDRTVHVEIVERVQDVYHVRLTSNAINDEMAELMTVSTTCPGEDPEDRFNENSSKLGRGRLEEKCTMADAPTGPAEESPTFWFAEYTGNELVR